VRWSDLLQRDVLQAGDGVTTDTRAIPAAGDVRELLRQLDATGTFRIDCAAEQSTEAQGLRWSADSFHEAGEDSWNFVCEPENVPDATIYRTQRQSHARFAYRIPVPPGKYELALHFFETWGQPGGQRFDVVLNGSPLLEGCVVRSPDRPHDAKVERREIDAPQGIVSLLFVPREGYVSVAGIELRWLGR
jgi:hypothetical protein